MRDPDFEAGLDSPEQAGAGAWPWAAGVFQAAGVFYVRRTGSGSRLGRIQCRLRDRTPLLRLRHILRTGHVNGPYDSPSGALGDRLTWIFQVNRQEEVARVGLRLRPLLCGQRQNQVARMLETMDYQLDVPRETRPAPARE